MPKEVTSPDEFLKLAAGAKECRVKKLGEQTKLKIRTTSSLYTIKLDAKAADELLGKINCPKNEL